MRRQKHRGNSEAISAKAKNKVARNKIKRGIVAGSSGGGRIADLLRQKS